MKKNRGAYTPFFPLLFSKNPHTTGVCIAVFFFLFLTTMSRKRSFPSATENPNWIEHCQRCGRLIYSQQPIYCPTRLGVPLLPMIPQGPFDSLDCAYSAVSDKCNGTKGVIATIMANNISRLHPTAPALRYIPMGRISSSPSSSEPHHTAATATES